MGGCLEKGPVCSGSVLGRVEQPGQRESGRIQLVKLERHGLGDAARATLDPGHRYLAHTQLPREIALGQVSRPPKFSDFASHDLKNTASVYI